MTRSLADEGRELTTDMIEVMANADTARHLGTHPIVVDWVV
jgi:hypothetical protein